MSYTLVENDSGILLQVTCLEGDPPRVANLTDCTAQLIWRVNDDEPQVRLMNIIDPVNGIASYGFAAGEIQPSEMEFEVRITDPAGFERSSLSTFTHRVRERMR